MQLALICFEDWHLKERICWIVREGIPGKTNEAWLLFCMAIPCNISQNRQMTPKFSEMNSSIVEDAQRGSQILQDIFAVVRFGEEFVLTETRPRQHDFIDTENQHTCPELVCSLHACQLQAMHFSEKLRFWPSRIFFYKGKGGLSIWQVPPDSTHSFPAFTKVH